MNMNTTEKDTITPTKVLDELTLEVVITKALITNLKKDIEKLGTKPAEGISKRQTVILCLSEITEARDRKVSFKALSEAFKQRGIEISAGNIGTYYRAAIAEMKVSAPKPHTPVAEDTSDNEDKLSSLEGTLNDVEVTESGIELRPIIDGPLTEEEIAFEKDLLERSKAVQKDRPNRVEVLWLQHISFH